MAFYRVREEELLALGFSKPAARAMQQSTNGYNAVIFTQEEVANLISAIESQPNLGPQIQQLQTDAQAAIARSDDAVNRANAEIDLLQQQLAAIKDSQQSLLIRLDQLEARAA